MKISNVTIDGVVYPKMELRVLGKSASGRTAYSLHGEPSRGDNQWVVTINPLVDAQQDDRTVYLFDDMRNSNIAEALVKSGAGTLTGKTLKHPKFGVDCPEFMFNQSVLTNL